MRRPKTVTHLDSCSIVHIGLVDVSGRDIALQLVLASEHYHVHVDQTLLDGRVITQIPKRVEVFIGHPCRCCHLLCQLTHVEFRVTQNGDSNQTKHLGEDVVKVELVTEVPRHIDIFKITR